TVTRQQALDAVAAREGRVTAVGVDLGDRRAPSEVLPMFRLLHDAPRPSRAIAPAFALEAVAGQVACVHGPAALRARSSDASRAVVSARLASQASPMIGRPVAASR